MRHWRMGALLTCALLVGAPLAYADSDTIRYWDGVYEVQPDGSIDVTTKIDYEFAGTDRHGIDHQLVLREPWDGAEAGKDRVYEISNVDVDSPTGAPDQFTTTENPHGAVTLLRIRIGDPDETLTESRHTYEISYTVEGALTTQQGRPELYWDINSSGDTHVDDMSIRVTAPEGIEEARCLIGSSECESTVMSSEATYSATDVDEAVSVVAGLPASSVEVAEPVLVEAAGRAEPPSAPDFMSRLPFITVAVFVLGTVLQGATTWFLRRPPEHRRWAGVAPGVMNFGGEETTDPPEGPSPVRFEPPEATLLEAGRSLDLGYKPSHLAAQLVQMAVAGSLAIRSQPLSVQQWDHTKLAGPVENDLFMLANHRGENSPLDKKQALAMTKELRDAPDGVDWPVTTKVVPTFWRNSFPPMLILPTLVLLVGAIYTLSSGGLSELRDGSILRMFGLLMVGSVTLFAFLFSAIVALNLTRALKTRRSKESLTPRGSAIRAQSEGFRQYLATAEAGQLNLEADRDIYRRYLPWAVLFGLTERWNQIGRELLDSGRLTLTDVTFAVDGADFARTHSLIHSLTSHSESAFKAQRSAELRESLASMSGGSGGSSGFSSGSFGGGGGGGSSTSSW